MHAEIVEPRLITVVENIFEYEAQPHHEIVFVFETGFADRALYDRAEFLIAEGALRTTASWHALRDLASGKAPLYPEGLLALLTSPVASP